MYRLKTLSLSCYVDIDSVVFPHDEPLAGRGARTSPLYDALLQRGCVYQSRHSYERPGWFLPQSDPRVGTQAPLPYDYYGAYSEDDSAWRLDNHDTSSIPAHDHHPYLNLVESELSFDWPSNWPYVAEECRASRDGVAIFDQSYFGKFFVQGRQALEAVQYLCGADLSLQVPGSVTYTPLCNARGGVEADLTVTRLPDDSGYYIAAGGSTMTKDFEWISRILEDQGFDVLLTDASADFAMISVQGPHSRSLLAPLITYGDQVLSADVMPFSTGNQLSIAGVDNVLCLRLTFVGELGFELHVPSQHAAHVYKTIRQAGDDYELRHNVPVRDAGYRAIDSLSAEKNFRHWHADLSNADTPMEAGIGFSVLPKLKHSEVDFLGRKALEEHRERGLRRKLVCLLVDPKHGPLHGMETIWRDGVCFGLVRSAAYGYTIGRTIAYGYIKREDDKKVTKKWLESGTWQIGSRGKLFEAKFSAEAPFDPKSIRVRGACVGEAIAV